MKIYDQLYARGAEYANASNRRSNYTSVDDAPTHDDDPHIPEFIPMTGQMLANDYGREVLERSIWGATYSSYLYEYL